MTIVRSEGFYAADPRRMPPEGTPRAFLPAFYHGPPGRFIAVPTAASRRRVGVVVNHGRWVIECPAAGCGGSQVASFTDRRFLCHNCLNADVGGKWLRVDWPDNWAEIEAALVERPEPSTRNWLGEPVEFLLHENERHGVESR